MFTSGLLILCLPHRALLSKLQSYLSVAKTHINKTLYISLKPTTANGTAKIDRRYLLPIIYSQASKYCANLDVRVLQGSLKLTTHVDNHVGRKIEVVLSDSLDSQDDLPYYLKGQFGIDPTKMPVIDIDVNESFSKDNQDLKENMEEYDYTCLGGTFDRLHNGHKVLLCEAISRSRKKLVIGVTDGPMIQGKILWELIEPATKRISDLRNFLVDVDPTLNYEIVPIFDPFGPAIEDEALECIVVSQETIRGGQKINVIREEKMMNPLAIYTIPLLEDSERSPSDEAKVSSSSLRKRLLGTYFKGPPAVKSKLPPRPHLIGLTGGIASGKSAIANDLVSMGAGLVDCDKLAHSTYERGSPIYQDIINEFGQDVLDSNGDVNRKILGSKVFGNEKKRQKLNGLVWPAVGKLVEEKVQDLFMEGYNVIVLEVALLIEAGWGEKVHEVWVTCIPMKEALKRVVERDGVTEDQARKRIQSQTSNQERISKANVVFCSLWDRQETRSQVKRAWTALENRLNEA